MCKSFAPLLAIVVISLHFGASAATATLTFDQAQAQLTKITGCPKKMVAKIGEAKAELNPYGQKGWYVLAAEDEAWAADLRAGPLAVKPNDAQVKSLIGKSMCIGN